MMGIKRHVVAGVLAFCLGHGAQAGDARVYAPSGLVPGEPTYWNWGGFYAGGSFGVTSANLDPQDATRPMVADLLRDTIIEDEANISGLPQLPKSSATGNSFGGFIGFNQQWDDVILSLELAYNYGQLSAGSSDSIARSYTASDGYLYNVALDSQASVDFKDYATLRARAGQVIGRFLPYAQLGLAIGRADIARSVSVALAGEDADPGNPPILPPVGLFDEVSERKNDAILFGMTAGVGLDIAIAQNIFLRGEYEYIHFFPVKSMTLDFHTGRIGAAAKF